MTNFKKDSTELQKSMNCCAKYFFFKKNLKICKIMIKKRKGCYIHVFSPYKNYYSRKIIAFLTLTSIILKFSFHNGFYCKIHLSRFSMHPSYIQTNFEVEMIYFTLVFMYFPYKHTFIHMYIHRLYTRK